jgi:preprotein translocase subunit SecF
MTFNIIKIRYFSYILSCVMLGLFFLGVFYKKHQRGSSFLYSVEFSGGAQVHCLLEGAAVSTTEEMKRALEKDKHYEGIIIRQFSNNEFLFRFPIGINKEITASEASDLIKNKLESIFGGTKVKIVDSSYVGPQVGGELKTKAIISILIALFLMSFYVWIRFRSFAFSVANGISLFHDVLVVLLLLLWYDFEISLDIVGAILFILGYSINDTIVIFSRIRDNIKNNNLKGESIANIINLSIKETLRRTILTSAFTALVVLPLWLFGGVSLEPLSAPILLGIIFGTYSSIGIASAVLYDYFKIIEAK